MQEKSKFVLIIAVVVVAILLFSTNPNLFNPLAADPTYHTGIPLADVNNLKTLHYVEDVWHGNDIPGTVDWPDKELMADTVYVTSFSGATLTGALSERIAIQGNVYENSGIETNIPETAYYKVELKEAGRDWITIVDLNVVDTRYAKVTGGVGSKTLNYNPVTPPWGDSYQRMDCPAIQVQIVGAHVGALRISFVVYFRGFLGIEHWYKTMSRDYCYLISGQGAINIAGHARTDVVMFENGETVPIQVTADYSGPAIGESGKWQLWAFPQDGRPGMMLKEWTYDYFRETYNWKLPDNAWVRGTSDSKWRIELRNTLFSTDAIMVNTIDVRANAPPTPKVTASVTQLSLNNQVTITMSGEINSLTNESISYFWVRCVYFSDNDNYQFLYQKVTVSPGTLTFTPPKAGKFKVQVWSHDVAGRESEKPAEITIEVLPSGAILPTPIIPGGWEIWLLFAIIIIVIIGVVMYFYQKRGMWKTPKLFRRKKR